MIRVTNKAAFDAKVSAWIAAVKAGAEKAVVKVMRDAQAFATMKSPVYSGDFGSNWNVSWGTPDETFVKGPIHYFEGDPPTKKPWGVGKFGNPATFKLGMKAYLTNASYHEEPYTDEDEYGRPFTAGTDTDYYAWKIEDNQIKWRPVNVGKDRVRGKTLEHLAHTYATIPKGLMV